MILTLFESDFVQILWIIKSSLRKSLYSTDLFFSFLSLFNLIFNTDSLSLVSKTNETLSLATNNDDFGSQESDGESSDHEFICCLCLSDVDYTMLPEDREKEKTNNETDDNNYKGEHKIVISEENETDTTKNSNQSIQCNETQVDDQIENEDTKKGTETEVTNHSKKEETSNGQNGETTIPDNNETSLSIVANKNDYRFDPNNALVLCDTPGCNRVYHQHCHFAPLFVVPRGDWHCLICVNIKQQQQQQQQQQSQFQVSPLNSPLQSIMGFNDNTPSKKKRGRPRKSALPPITIKPTMLQFMSSIYPPQTDLSMLTTNPLLPPALPPSTLSIPSGQAPLPDFTQPHLSALTALPTSSQSPLPPNSNEQIQNFEWSTSKLKMMTINNNLQKLQASVSQCLTRIRSSENAIRIYTESERSRKTIIICASEQRNLPAELVLSKHKCLSNQYRIRMLLESLENYIKFGGESESVRGRMEPRCKEEDDDDEDSKARNEDEKDKDNVDGINKKQEDSKLEAIYNLGQLIKQDNVTPGNKNHDDHSENDIIRCSLCFSSESTKDNDIVLCDGMACCRAFHMNCLIPKVTREEIDNDSDGTWFCPYCSTLGKLIHYTQTEYYGDEDENDETSDNWEVVEDVFKGIEDEMKVWGLRRDGEREIEIKNGMIVSKQTVLKLLGVEEDENVIDEDEDEEDDEDYSEEKNEKMKVSEGTDADDDDSCSHSSDSLNDLSSVEDEIDEEEINALNSGEESDDEYGSDDNEGNKDDDAPIAKRRRRRNVEPETDKDTDVGTLDERNILRGKRRRTKVDYRRYVAKYIPIMFCSYFP